MRTLGLVQWTRWSTRGQYLLCFSCSLVFPQPFDLFFFGSLLHNWASEFLPYFPTKVSRDKVNQSRASCRGPEFIALLLGVWLSGVRANVEDAAMGSLSKSRPFFGSPGSHP